jgi:hypothetical protein
MMLHCRWVASIPSDVVLNHLVDIQQQGGGAGPALYGCHPHNLLKDRVPVEETGPWHVLWISSWNGMILFGGTVYRAARRCTQTDCFDR